MVGGSDVFFSTRLHNGVQMSGGVSTGLDSGITSYDLTPTVTAAGLSPQTNSDYYSELKGNVSQLVDDSGNPVTGGGTGHIVTVGKFDFILDPLNNHDPNQDSFHGTYTANGDTHSVNMTYEPKPFIPILLPGQTRDEPGRGTSTGGGNNPPPTPVVNITDVKEPPGSLVTGPKGTTTTIEVDYTVTGATAQPFTINLYRAAEDHIPVGNPPDGTVDLGVQTIGGSGLTMTKDILHKVFFTITGKRDNPMGIDGFHPYVVAVASSGSSKEVSPSANQKYFQIITIGVVSEGFTFGVPWSDTNPQWIADMTSALMDKDEFTDAIGFSWHSSLLGYKADSAGALLYAQVAKAVADYQAKFPKAVFAFDFIGHSRGTVVISAAVAMLYKEAHSLGVSNDYVKMTFLDPHPAHPVYGRNASSASGLKSMVAAPIVAAYVAFQAATKDGPVSVTKGVNEVEDFYEDTSSGNLTATETLINLHGLAPNQIQNFSSAPSSLFINLTDRHVNPDDPNSRVIGHGETVDWFQLNAVDTGKVGTGEEIKS